MGRIFGITSAILTVLWLGVSLCALTSEVRATALPPAGLVSWWPAEGDGLDLIGGNRGVLHSGTTFAPGIVGQAFRFDGRNDGINVADSENLKITDSLTISAWISVASFPQGHAGPIWFRGDDRAALDPYALSTQQGGTIQFHLEALTPQQGVNLYAAIPLGRFVHVAAIFDSTVGLMRIYRDGVLAAQTITDVRPFRDLEQRFSPGCGIGNHGRRPASPHNHPFHGLIDELQIYRRALAAREVRSLFAAGAAGRRSLAVDIDVMPGNLRNIIDLRGTSIDVAILSAAAFDAPGQVNLNTLTFGATGDEQSLILSRTDRRDVNGDGRIDLVGVFRTGTAGFRLEDTEGILQGHTINGTAIVGAAPVIPAFSQ
jgi:hypothetical protein